MCSNWLKSDVWLGGLVKFSESSLPGSLLVHSIMFNQYISVMNFCFVNNRLSINIFGFF